MPDRSLRDRERRPLGLSEGELVFLEDSFEEPNLEDLNADFLSPLFFDAVGMTREVRAFPLGGCMGALLPSSGAFDRQPGPVVGGIGTHVNF